MAAVHACVHCLATIVIMYPKTQFRVAAVHACVHCLATTVMKYAKDHKSKQNRISIKINIVWLQFTLACTALPLS